MANTVVGVTIEGRDKASKAFESVGKAAEKFGAEIEKAGEGLQSVGKAASGLAKKLTIGVTGPLSAVAAMSVKAAMESGRLEQSLEGLAGSADEAARYVEAIQTASRGTVSSMDAMAVASRALSFGIVENAGDMERLTEIAITLGRAQGLSATQSVSDLTTALARQSPMILDNLGITLKLTDAYRIYAESLGKTADQLTGEEKQQAFLNAAMIEGEKVMERMGGVQEDAAASAERLNAQLSDAAVALGEQLIPFVVAGAEKLTDMVAAFNAMDESAQKAIVALGGVAVAAGPALKAFSGIVTVMPALGASVGNAAAGFTLLAEGASAAEVASLGLSGTIAVAIPVVAALAAVLIAAKKAHDLRADAMEREAEVGDAWTGMLREQVETGGSAVDLAEEYVAAQKRVAGELENTSIMMGWFIDEQAILNSDVHQLVGAIFEASDSFEDYQKALETVGLGSAEVGVYTDELAYNLAKTGEAAGDTVGDIESVGNAWVTAGEDMKLGALAVGETGTALGRAREDYERFSGGMVEGIGRVSDAADDAWPSINSLKDSVLDMGKAFATGVPDAEDMWNMVLQTGRAAGMTATELGALAVSMGVAGRAEVEAQIAGFQIVEAWERGAATGQDLIAVTQGLEAYSTRLAEAERLGAEAAAQMSPALGEQADAMRDSAQAAFEMAQRVSESGMAAQEADKGVSGMVQGMTAMSEEDREAALAALEVAIAEDNAREALLLRQEQLTMTAEETLGARDATGEFTNATDLLTERMGLSGETTDVATTAVNTLGGAFVATQGKMQGMQENMTPLLTRFGELEHFAKGINEELENMPKRVDILVAFHTEGTPPPGTALGGAGGGGGVPGLQAGTPFAPGGLALVGEAGPELVALPRGARVFPADETQGMLTPAAGGAGGGGGLGGLTVNIYGASEPQASADAVIAALRDRGMLAQTSYR